MVCVWGFGQLASFLLIDLGIGLSIFPTPCISAMNLILKMVFYHPGIVSQKIIIIRVTIPGFFYHSGNDPRMTKSWQEDILFPGIVTWKTKSRRVKIPGNKMSSRYCYPEDIWFPGNNTHKFFVHRVSPGIVTRRNL